MKGKTEEKGESQRLAERKRAWSKPLLTRLGHIKDFVQGRGKGGSHTDGDPFTMRRK